MNHRRWLAALVVFVVAVVVGIYVGTLSAPGATDCSSRDPGISLHLYRYGTGCGLAGADHFPPVPSEPNSGQSNQLSKG